MSLRALGSKGESLYEGRALSLSYFLFAVCRGEALLEVFYAAVELSLWLSSRILLDWVFFFSKTSRGVAGDPLHR